MVLYLHGLTESQSPLLFELIESYLGRNARAPGKGRYDRMSVAFDLPEGMGLRDILKISRKELEKKIISALSYRDTLMAANYPEEKFEIHPMDVAELGGIATVKEHRGKGYAKQLIEGMLRDLGQRGRKAVVTTDASSEAVEFLAKLGWEPGIIEGKSETFATLEREVLRNALEGKEKPEEVKRFLGMLHPEGKELFNTVIRNFLDKQPLFTPLFRGSEEGTSLRLSKGGGTKIKLVIQRPGGNIVNFVKRIQPHRK